MKLTTSVLSATALIALVVCAWPRQSQAQSVRDEIGAQSSMPAAPAPDETRERLLRKKQAEHQIMNQIKDLTEKQKHLGPRFNFVGKLEIGKGTTYSVNGEDIEIDKDAMVSGRLALGVNVDIQGIIAPGGRKIATDVVVSNPASPSSSASSEASSRAHPLDGSSRH